jgi:hypothetical protein
MREFVFYLLIALTSMIMLYEIIWLFVITKYRPFNTYITKTLNYEATEWAPRFIAIYAGYVFFGPRIHGLPSSYGWFFLFFAFHAFIISKEKILSTKFGLVMICSGRITYPVIRWKNIESVNTSVRDSKILIIKFVKPVLFQNEIIINLVNDEGFPRFTNITETVRIR